MGNAIYSPWHRLRAPPSDSLRQKGSCTTIPSRPILFSGRGHIMRASQVPLNSRRSRRAQLQALRRATSPVERLEARRLLAGVQLTGLPNYLNEGPQPTINSGNVVVDGRNQASGAVSAIVADPSNSSRIFIAAINGGIWRTDNANADYQHWNSLTDNFSSLSTRALAMSPLNS